MLSLTISVAYAAVCVGWGLLIARAFSHCRIKITIDRRSIDDKSILVASSFLAGAAVISTLLTALGLVGQLRLLPLIFVLLPGVIGLMLDRKRLQDLMYASLEALRAARAMRPWLLLIGGFTVLLALGASCA